MQSNSLVIVKDTYLALREKSYSENRWNDVDLPYVIDQKDITGQIVHFFTNGSQLVYPAKSFFVAIVYAKAFEKFFGEDFRQMLDDEELLPDDKFFMRYSFAKSIYDDVLLQIGDVWQYESIQPTLRYFKAEFLVDSN